MVEERYRSRCVLLLAFLSRAGVWGVLIHSSDAPDDSVELHHAGHPPLHVTRLARLRHDGGFESLLEAEVRWSRGAVSPEQRFHISSPAQLRALGTHQAAVLSHRSNNGQALANMVEEYPAPSDTPTMMTTPLVPTKSLYMGPIGVGLTVPAGCGRSLVELADRACAAIPETTLNVVYDTGSTNIWIASDLCDVGACVGAGRQRFNHSRSASFNYPTLPVEVSVQFGTGELFGPLGVDDLRVGPVAVRQPFLMIQSQSGRIWDDNPIEGIVGLGFPALATKSATPFFDNMIRQTALKNNEFAFYLSRESASSNALLWGGIDPAFYEGDVEYFPVVDTYY